MIGGSIIIKLKIRHKYNALSKVTNKGVHFVDKWGEFAILGVIKSKSNHNGAIAKSKPSHN